MIGTTLYAPTQKVGTQANAYSYYSLSLTGADSAGVQVSFVGYQTVSRPLALTARAGTTGYLRMVNEKHWISDGLVEADTGLLSAKAAYYVYSWLKQTITRRTHRDRSTNGGKPGS